MLFGMDKQRDGQVDRQVDRQMQEIMTISIGADGGQR